ncbi:MAG: radical SAM protein [Geobacteraceae bacterium]|nr:radical SAM protein [Geobacteraceae bacterium]
MNIERLIRKTGSLRKRLFTETAVRTGLNIAKPSFICAKMTMECNSRCVHCDIWQTTYGEVELSTVEWFRILGELRSWLGRFRMVFTGGEALLRKDLPEILSHAVRLGIDVELLSNGIIIDSQLAARLVAMGLEQITVSYDGITAEVHDRFRGAPGYHAATTAAIRALVLERQAQQKSLKILLKTVISANNLPQLSNIAEFARELGVQVRYQPIEQNYGEAFDQHWYRQSHLWVDDLPLLRQELQTLKLMKDGGTGIIENQTEEFDFFLNYFKKPESLMETVQAHDNRVRKGFCPSAFGNFVIESSGDVRMCFRMESIGNVAVTKPEKIWKERKRCWRGDCGLR